MEFGVHDRADAMALLNRIKKALPNLDVLLRECSGELGYEDPIYRYYSQSWKVSCLREQTAKIVEALTALAPGRTLSHRFLQIAVVRDESKSALAQGADAQDLDRSGVEAFFHARFFLEMSVRYGRLLDQPPRLMPSGWAALLSLYSLR